jgi:CheY-like chemotaxis protein
MKVLILEDSPENQLVLSWPLKKRKIECLQTSSIEEAIDLLSKTQVQLILVDLLLPQGNGLEFIYKVKKRELWKKIPIIVISSLDDKKVITKAMEVGANDYLVKPIEQKLYQQKLATFLPKSDLPEEDVYLVNPDDNQHSLDFKFQVEIHQLSEKGIIFFSNSFWRKNLSFKIESPLLGEIGITSPPLLVKDVQRLGGEEGLYQITTEFEALAENDRYHLRQWLLKKNNP